MRVMKLIDEMCEELHGAKTYAKCYIKYKDTNSLIAKQYYEMSEDELRHAKYMHDMAAEEIERLSATSVTLAEFLASLWSEKSEMYSEKVTKVHAILEME